MAESLRDQLLKSGLVQKFKTEAKPVSRPGAAKKPATVTVTGEVDLAQAYALRAKTEREERERIQREAEQKAREKRERREKLARLLSGKALNAEAAELPRHFPHGGKIRRVYCTPDQLAAVNRGEIGIVQMNGRYLLVPKALALEAQAIQADVLVLLVDPHAPQDDDVPDDLVW